MAPASETLRSTPATDRGSSQNSIERKTRDFNSVIESAALELPSSTRPLILASVRGILILMTEFGANGFSERRMSLRLVKGSGSTPAAPKEIGATAFLLIDPRGGVRVALGWESLSVDPAPRSLAATD